MCRLFGLTAGQRRVEATFWLLDAPDSLRDQSRRNPDGTGLATFSTDGAAVVEKQPLRASEDEAFAREARRRSSTTFLAHVRRATGTPVSTANTHPFEMDGRVFAHNGEVGEIGLLEQHLGPDLDRVAGDTDSERVFALVTREIERAGGDVTQGLVTAATWVAGHLPVVALNVLLATEHDLWALRYPDARELWLLDRREPREELEHRSSMGTRVHSPHLHRAPSVVLASEPLDGDPGWRLLEPGTLVHVDPELSISAEPALG